jgi:hypothetical protein
VSDAAAKSVAQIQRHAESANRLVLRNLDTIKTWHGWEADAWGKIRRERAQRKKEAGRTRPYDPRLVVDECAVGPVGPSDSVPLTLTGQEPATNIQNGIGGDESGGAVGDAVIENVRESHLETKPIPVGGPEPGGSGGSTNTKTPCLSERERRAAWTEIKRREWIRSRDAKAAAVRERMARSDVGGMNGGAGSAPSTSGDTIAPHDVRGP